MSGRHIAAILFDMDGVIVNSESLHEEAFRQTIQVHRFSLSHGDYQCYFAGRTDRDGFEAFFRRRPHDIRMQALLQEKTSIFLHLAAADIIPYDSIIGLIKHLDDEAMKLALVTGSNREETMTILRALGITENFRAIVTADDVSAGKPDPEAYLRAAALLSAEPSRCVVIEDSPSGVKAAQAGGMSCIAVTTTHHPAELSGATKIIAPPLKHSDIML